MASFFGMPGPWTISLVIPNLKPLNPSGSLILRFCYRLVTRNLQVTSWRHIEVSLLKLDQTLQHSAFNPGVRWHKQLCGAPKEWFYPSKPEVCQSLFGFYTGNWRLEPKTWWFGSMLTSFSKEIFSGSILKFSGCSPPSQKKGHKKHDFLPAMYVYVYPELKWNQTTKLCETKIEPPSDRGKTMRKRGWQCRVLAWTKFSKSFLMRRLVISLDPPMEAFEPV